VELAKSAKPAPEPASEPEPAADLEARVAKALKTGEQPAEQAPEVAAVEHTANVPEPPPGFIEKASDFFLDLISDKESRVEPEAPPSPKPITEPEDKWEVRGVETAKAVPEKEEKKSKQATRQGAPGAPGHSLTRYLAGTTLTLGKSVRLGIPPLAPGAAQSKPCIEKREGSITFCIEEVDWPEWIEPYFQVNSVMYQGSKAIARYDEGVATSYHSIFPTGSFPAVLQYYTSRFGKPTRTLNRSIAPLASPRRENPTAIWQSIDKITKQVTTLEVRKFDDARGTFPDTRRGAVMLYQQWSTPIFPYLSTLELMILNAQGRAG